MAALIADAETKLAGAAPRTIIIALTLWGRHRYTCAQYATQDTWAVVIALASVFTPALAVDTLELRDGAIVVFEAKERR